MRRIVHHPILQDDQRTRKVRITVNGVEIEAYEGEMIAAALIANGIDVFRYTQRQHQPRGVYCGIGRCTDCDDCEWYLNVRTCVTRSKREW